MEDALKKLTKIGAFANSVLFSSHQKAYFDGPAAQNEDVLFAPTVSKHHCIFYHNSNGLFVKVEDIGLFKYQEVTNAHDESIKEEDLSDTNINNESKLEDATGGMKDTDYEENWRSIPAEESINLEVSREIKEELNFEEETREISVDEIHSSMQITIEEEDLKPLFLLNSIGEALADTKSIVEISRDPDAYIVSNKQSAVSDEISRKQNISKSPRELSKQLNISNNENSFHSKNDDEQFLSKFNKSSIQTINLEQNSKTKILERLHVENSESTMEIFQTHSMEKLANESVKQFKTHSVKKPGDDSVRKLRTESSSSERKLEAESVTKLETNFVQQLGIDSVQNLLTRSSSSVTDLEINETEQLATRKKPESSKRKIAEEIIENSPSMKKWKFCQEEEKTDLREKRLIVTLIDIVKYPNSDLPTMGKFPADSTNKRRINRRKTGPPFKCPECLKIHSSKFDLKRHLMTHEEKIFSCVYCDKKFSSKHYLYIHKKTHTPEKPYKCGKCGKGFSINSLLQRHVVMHIKERPFSCDICKKTYKRKSAVRRHLRIHAGLKFKCKECFKLFFWKYDLQSHMKHHANAKEYKCLQCDKSYNVKSVLNLHVRKIHTRMGLHKCNVCEKMFRDKIQFEEHQRIHTGERPFACDICKKPFRGKTDLRSHMKSHVPKVTCNECQETFPNKSDLKRHLSIHFPKKGYNCPECGHVASRPSSLVKHLRVHTGDLVRRSRGKVREKC